MWSDRGGAVRLAAAPGRAVMDSGEGMGFGQEQKPAAEASRLWEAGEP